MSRFARIVAEDEYGVAKTTTSPYRLVGESIKRKHDTVSIRPERQQTDTRQYLRRVWAEGGLDVYLPFDKMPEIFSKLFTRSSTETLNIPNHAYRDLYVPDPNFTPASLTVDICRDLEVHRYTGLFFNSMKLSIGLQDRHFGVSLQCMASDEAPAGSVPTVTEFALQTPPAIGGSSDTPFAVGLTDGVTTWVAKMEALEILFRWDRMLRWSAREMNPTGIKGGGVFGLSGKVQWYYDAETDFLLDDFRSRAELGMTFSMTGDLIGGSGSRKNLSIRIPTLKINGDPPTLKRPGRGNIDFSVGMDALDYEVSGSPCELTTTYHA